MALGRTATESIIAACRRMKQGHPTWDDTVLIMGYMAGLMGQLGADDLANNLLVEVFENARERLDADQKFQEMMIELRKGMPCIVMPH